MLLLARTAFTILFFLVSVSRLMAQEATAVFRVTDAQKTPIAFATVVVLPMPDSANKHQGITDSSGSIAFALSLSRPYLVRITAVGYQPLEKSILSKDTKTVFHFTLAEISKTLNNVVVNATRPLMRQEDDKTIVDPEQLAASSTNAYEILEKTPGLFMDQDGNIYLNSTTPATIYINGREQKMSTADVAAMLKSLPPGSIASIEILRTPSARYDASGSGGIVNVVLKKGVRIGLTGSISMGLNQGHYGNQFAGININNNNGRLSSYVNLQYSRRNNFEELETNRIFSADSVLWQQAFTRYPTASYYAGFGASYSVNRKWELAYDGRGSINLSRNRSTNISELRKRSTGEVGGGNEADVRNRGASFHVSQSFSLKAKLDTIGSEWTTDLSHTYAPNNLEQQLHTSFFAPVFFESSSDGDIQNRLQFFSAQSNLVKKLPRKFTVESGIKTTQVLFRNSTDYFRQYANDRIRDNSRSGSYRYRENISAAYLQASKNISGVIIKAGSRLEHTFMNGRQLSPVDTAFRLSRTDLFPYIYISRSLMQIAGYDLRAYLVYRRTTSRPAYEYLNPSVRVVDPYLFESGNPSLRPQFTKNYEANISVDERPIVAIGYNDTRDIFTQVVYGADTSRSVSYRTYDNLGRSRETYLRGLGAIPPGKRYFFVVGTQYNHNFYEGQYEQKPLRYKRGSWFVFTYQTFKLTPLTQITLQGFARLKGQVQFYELSALGALNLSLTQQLMKKKLTLTLNATDVFYTNQYEFVLNQGSINAFGARKNDTRRFGLNLRYNFGLRKKEEATNMFQLEPEGK